MTEQTVRCECSHDAFASNLLSGGTVGQSSVVEYLRPDSLPISSVPLSSAASFASRPLLHPVQHAPVVNHRAPAELNTSEAYSIRRPRAI